MKREITSQYAKAMDMMEECLELYNENLWTDRAYQNPAWQVCYHGLFYTNIYLSPTEQSIRQWPGQRADYHDLRKLPASKDYVFEKEYTRGEMKDFLAHIKNNLAPYMEFFEPEKPCWPFWYDQNQLEFHMTNLRHFQQHTAELLERLNNTCAISYHWK